jgi:hypothetical protein
MFAFTPVPEMEAPGLWRRIALWPQPGLIVGGLEDDVHRFIIRMTHQDGKITGFTSAAERFPWSTCGGAADFIDSELIGKSLADIARLDRPQHCTHLYELAVLCAGRAHDTQPSQFDLQVLDRVEDRTLATAYENGRKVLEWNLHGTVLEAPEELKGRDMRQFRHWMPALAPELQTPATLLRRAIFVSGSRRQNDTLAKRASDRPPERMGVCYTYQMPRAEDAVQKPIWRIDFSHSADGPLQGFDPESIAYDQDFGSQP